ncbi:MAG TPA: alpha/beta hydrolase, partial [Flavilitoribacter sp.]|nr:alpha/beta hydrolase [Flavilitoribacter sp.]
MNRIISTLALLGLLSGCAASQPAASFDIREFLNMPYTDGPEADSLQSLHLVVPQSETASPLLIWIGGGAWAYVNKDMELDLARNLGRKGIAVASVGHRLSPAVWRDPKKTEGIQHPKHAEDVAAAVKWLYDHAAEYGYDREKFFIGG